MQSFVETNREEPAKEDVSRRIRTSRDLPVLQRSQVARQAERCVQCGDPFCTTIGCRCRTTSPVVEAIAEKDLEKAFLLSNESSPFPNPRPNLPAQPSLRRSLHPGRRLWSDQHRPDRSLDQRSGLCRRHTSPSPGHHRQEGSGGRLRPGGMSCAHFLLRAASAWRCMNAHTAASAGLRHPGFKLDKRTVERRFAILQAPG